MTHLENFSFGNFAEEVGSRTKASALTDVIRRDVIQGVFPPGAKLKPRELAERYDVGTVPLREALSRLVLSGFVEAEDQRGFRVAKVSVEELIDLTKARSEIESLALRNAITTGDLSWETGVLAASHKLERTSRHDPATGLITPSWERAHDAFHVALLVGCGSAWLIRICNLLRDQVDRYRQLSLEVEIPAGRDVLLEHKLLTAAVLARDANQACLLLQKHFSLTSDLALNQIRDRMFTSASAGQGQLKIENG